MQKKILVAFFGMVLLLGTVGTQNIIGQDHTEYDIESHCTMTDFMADGNHTLAIMTARVGDDLSYNITGTTPKLPKNTCVMIMLMSKDTQDPHDFTIDMVHDADDIMILSSVHLSVNKANSTHPTQMAMFMMMTPTINLTITYYCSEPGHKSLGMEGEIDIGEGTPAASSGFELPIFIFTFVSLISIISIKRKRD